MSEWFHLNNGDVLSPCPTPGVPLVRLLGPLAFHCIPLARIDPDFAKDQLVLLGREWYMHPNGQLRPTSGPSATATPPVHARAALHVFEIDRDHTGRADYGFLEPRFFTS